MATIVKVVHKHLIDHEFSTASDSSTAKQIRDIIKEESYMPSKKHKQNELYDLVEFLKDGQGLAR